MEYSKQGSCSGREVKANVQCLYSKYFITLYKPVNELSLATHNTPSPVTDEEKKWMKAENTFFYRLVSLGFLHHTLQSHLNMLLSPLPQMYH